jgi:hypothetical protein
VPYHLSLMSSRALAVLSKDCANGMDLTNCLETGDLLREGSDSVKPENKLGHSNLNEVLRDMTHAFKEIGACKLKKCHPERLLSIQNTALMKWVLQVE